MPDGIKMSCKLTCDLSDITPNVQVCLIQLMEEAYKAGYTDGKIDMLETIGRMTTRAHIMED